MSIYILLFTFLLLAFILIILYVVYDVRKSFKINPVHFYANAKIDGKKLRGYVSKRFSNGYFVFVSENHNYYKVHQSQLNPQINMLKIILKNRS